MRRYLFLISLLLISIFLFFSGRSAAAPPTPPPPSDDDREEVVEQRILDAIKRQREYVLGFIVYEVRVVDVQISQDGNWAIGYLEMIDPDSGEIIPTEPGLAIAQRKNEEWTITLPADVAWADLVRSTPDDLLTESQKSVFIEMNAIARESSTAVYSGYLLPWEAGKTVYLSQSVGHDQYIPSGSAHFAFDFYISKTMYRLFASKAGTVWRARWDVPNGDDSDMGNYLVLQDTTTTPTTYQLYLHLAQDSIPPALRTPGAYVAQGQFIGIADDTGQSTGHHLHFQVHSNPNSYWGTALDITFTDVDINGGRPRVSSDAPYCKSTDVCDQFRSAYISGNVIRGDLTPPEGGLVQPSTGTTLTTRNVHIEGWASDIGSGVDKAQVIAYYDNAWHNAGEPISSSSTFTLDWDMCADDVPDGPVSLAVRVWDKEGNPSMGYPGLTHIIKDKDCNPKPPACTPESTQVALFSDTDFRGDCVILGEGDYRDMSTIEPISEDEVESILVGGEVLATLFSEQDFNGRSSTHSSADANLADNTVGNNSASSITIMRRSTPPLKPKDLIAPPDGATIPGGSSLSFHWRDPGGALEFQVRVVTPDGVVNSPWLDKSFWHLDQYILKPGNYSWKVRSRNCQEITCWSGWGASSTFTVSDPPVDPPVLTAPFTDDLETEGENWLSSGLWNRLSDSQRAHSGLYSWYYGHPAERHYDDGKPNFGDLTLRPIVIPSTGYILRFWYRYQTEGDEGLWDQRWVQISENGGPFRNVLQLYDEVQNDWLQATLDLGNYAGKTIKIRFHFATMDNIANADFEGWYIDDIEVIQLALPDCSDHDNTPENARLLNFGQTLNGKMCPTGDVDYYKFEGTAGDHIVLDIDTPPDFPSNDLDLVLYLIESDGTSIISVHDDEIYGEKLDPHLGYQLTQSGTYYVKARLWAYPTTGGEDYTYKIKLTKDNGKPTASFTNPRNSVYLPNTSDLVLTVNAGDSSSGVSRVEFLFHSGDWTSSSWQLLGVDQDGIDGWSYNFNLTGLSDQKDVAFFANVFDWAGNWRGTGVFDIGIDRTPPTTTLKQLSTNQTSTAILLEWNGSDNLSGMDYYEIQSQIGDGSWANISPNPDGTSTRIWFIGTASTNYGFRTRGVDVAGNIETFPGAAETRTSIPAANVLCSTPDQGDFNRDDNSPQNAIEISVGDPASLHNFCNPLRSDRLHDEDWIKFNAKESETYLIQAIPQSPMSATILELYGLDGSTLLAKTQSKEFGENAQMTWKSEENQVVFLRIRHIDGRVIGNPVSYRLVVGKLSQMFLPVINH